MELREYINILVLGGPIFAIGIVAALRIGKIIAKKTPNKVDDEVVGELLDLAEAKKRKQKKEEE